MQYRMCWGVGEDRVKVGRRLPPRGRTLLSCLPLASYQGLARSPDHTTSALSKHPGLWNLLPCLDSHLRMLVAPRTRPGSTPHRRGWAGASSRISLAGPGLWAKACNLLCRHQDGQGSSACRQGALSPYNTGHCPSTEATQVNKAQGLRAWDTFWPHGLCLCLWMKTFTVESMNFYQEYKSQFNSLIKFSITVKLFPFCIFLKLHWFRSLIFQMDFKIHRSVSCSHI